MDRKLIYGTLALSATLATILAIIISHGRKSDLEVSFFNVGQGDAILVSQGSNQVLIDGGKDGKLLLQKIGKSVPFWDRNIEAIIQTHPDYDHVGGFIDLLEAYEVRTVLKTDATSDSATFKQLQEKIEKENPDIVEAEKNVKLVFPSGAELEILYPFGPVSDDQSSNENSVVAKLAFGENSFLLTGDFPSTQEKDIINLGEDLKADVLKIAHHGSKYSTSEEFLDAVSPQAAIISVGKNSYGHPNQEVLDRLIGHKANILRTDEIGDIICECQNSNNPCMVAKQAIL